MSFTKISCVLHFALTAVTLSGAALLSLGITQAESQSPAQPEASSPAQPATAAKPGRANIAAQNVAGTNQIAIPLGVSIPKYSVTRLSAPERLVIDLESTQISYSQIAKQKDLEYVSGVRVGTHPNKTRIVVDLKDGKAVTHEAHIDNGMLMLTVASAATQKASVANKKDRAADNKKPQQSNSNQSHLALEEQAVVSGSSKADSAPSAPAVTQPSAIKQPTAFEKPVRSLRAPIGSGSVDRAMISPASLEQMMVAAQVFTPVKIQEASSQAIANLIAAKLEGEGLQTRGLPAFESPKQLFAKSVESKEAADSTEKQSQKAKTTKITSILLEDQATSSPAVVIAFNGGLDHIMTRTAPSEYVVTLRDTLAEAQLLQQTMFASQASSGIRSVRVIADGDNTLVRIFTQPSSYLTATQNGTFLKIEQTQDLAQIARDIRAQIAPAALKEGSAGKDAASSKVAKDANTAAQKDSSTEDKPAKQKKEDVVLDPNYGELAAIKGSSLTYTGRLISLDLQDADIDSALRIIAEVSNLNIVAGDGVVGKVTLKLVDVPWDQALEVILKSHGLDKVLEGNVLRVAPVDKLRAERESFKQAKVAEEELEPLSVKYIRVSYAKAAEIKSLVETVLSERGTVAFDERSNQLVVKDTRKGLQNVTELIKKIDLRTPQILLETQIIEANRNLSRQLGAELGFQYIQSPATGNGTGLNFPSAIAVGGSADPTNSNSITGSAFPVASTASLGSAVTMLFDSADGTKSLALRLSQLEQEGQVRIISKPAVATTNNKAAEIKSVEKYRVKLPNGGLSIASGSGASSSGSGDVATQTIEAGIILNVTPQASPDYYILLDIRAKSSSFGAKSVDGIPNEIERSASSSVLVSSGQTFALGGIYKITEQDRISGVPFFKDIPVLGTLFRNTTTEQSDEELLFFITPRIVEGSFEDATVKVIS